MFPNICLKLVNKIFLFRAQLARGQCPTALSFFLTCDGRRHSAAQGSDGSHGDFLTAVLGGAGVSGCDHVWFQQGALQVDMVVRQRLVHCCENLTGGQGFNGHGLLKRSSNLNTEL